MTTGTFIGMLLCAGAGIWAGSNDYPLWMGMVVGLCAMLTSVSICEYLNLP